MSLSDRRKALPAVLDSRQVTCMIPMTGFAMILLSAIPSKLFGCGWRSQKLDIELVRRFVKPVRLLLTALCEKLAVEV